MHLPGRYVPGNDASYGGHGSGCDMNARGDHGFCADPGPIFDRDWSRHDSEARIGPVVVSGTKIRALGDTHIRADADVDPIVDPGVLSDPAIAADRKMPGVPDAHTGFDDHAGADSGAEQPEQHYTKTR